MFIGVDGNEANVDKRVGIGEYAYELLKEFYKYSSSNLQFVIYLKNVPASEFPKATENWAYRIIRPVKLWTQIGLACDLFFCIPITNLFVTPSHYALRCLPLPTA